MALGSKLQWLIKCLTRVDSKVQQPVILGSNGISFDFVPVKANAM